MSSVANELAPHHALIASSALPPKMRLLLITTGHRLGGWLADAFVAESGSDVGLEEVVGVSAGLARLRDDVFDAILLGHEPGRLDSIKFVEAMRGGGGDEPVIVMGVQSEQEMLAPCYEAGADGYVCVNTVTTRTLLCLMARATQRFRLTRDCRRWRRPISIAYIKSATKLAVC